MIFFLIYRRQRERERTRKLVRIKQRLGGLGEPSKPTTEPKKTHIYPKYITFDRIKKLVKKRKEDENAGFVDYVLLRTAGNAGISIGDNK